MHPRHCPRERRRRALQRPGALLGCCGLAGASRSLLLLEESAESHKRVVLHLCVVTASGVCQQPQHKLLAGRCH
jgi:hypothetical protein